MHISNSIITMDSPPDMLDFSPGSSLRSASKPYPEPDCEESPLKPPAKKSRVDLKVLRNWNIEPRKVPNNAYERVHSHSAARQKESEDSELRIRKKLFMEIGEQSYARKLSSASRYGVDERNKAIEIEQLNNRIKNLIREKNDLKNQIESQNLFINQLKGNQSKRLGGMFGSSLENAMLDVTFKPQENWESNVQKHKRFPREVFRLPKGKVIN